MGSNQSPAQRTESTLGGKPASTASIILIVSALAVLVAGAIYLFETNPEPGLWEQRYDPAGNWVLSTLLAALPVIVLLGAMAILRMKAHVAAAIGLLTALTVALVVYQMPMRLALTTTVYGAGYGLFPICWIILPVIFLYQLTVKTGRFTALQQSVANITDDGRLQLLLIAFALGAFLAALGGVVGGTFLGVYPGLDFEMLPLAFAVVIIGGMGSLGGAAIGAMLVGLADNFGKALFPELAYFTLYAPMVLILAVKPTGLFGRE